MKDLHALLQKAAEDFAPIRPGFEEKKERVKKINSLEDLEAINGVERTKHKLGEISAGPDINQIGLERLIGKNNLMDVYFLEQGLEVARTVCRIIKVSSHGRAPWGTGFMVAPGLLMTNNHVIETPADGKQLMAEFEYEKRKTGINTESYFFQLDPQAFFVTDPVLDYTIIGVEPLAANDPGKKLTDYKWNTLAPSKEKILVGESLTIIQHPQGQPKMIAFRENKVVSLEGDLVHYTTDTQQGSSGSLVANDKWEIVALHRSGVPEKDANGNILLTKGGVWKGKEDTPYINWVANQGVLIDSVLQDLVGKEPTGNRADHKRHLLENYDQVQVAGGYRLPKRK